MENGAHVNWKSDQKGIINKAVTGKGLLSKILRYYTSSKYKNILKDYHKN